MNRVVLVVVLLIAVLIYGANQEPATISTSSYSLTASTTSSLNYSYIEYRIFKLTEEIIYITETIVEIKSKINSLNGSVITSYSTLTSSISEVRSKIDSVNQSVADLSRSVAELNDAVRSMYLQSKRLEDRLNSANLALAVSLAVAVVSLVMAVMAWRRSSRQSVGGYDVCG